MLSKCGAGEDSWESLGHQGDPTSQSLRKSTLKIHWIDWYWSSNTLATWCIKPTHWKRPRCWERRQEEKWTTEDEMAGWHQWVNGHEFEQAPGVGDGQGSLACCTHGVTEGQTWLRDWRASQRPFFSLNSSARGSPYSNNSFIIHFFLGTFIFAALWKGYFGALVHLIDGEIIVDFIKS